MLVVYARASTETGQDTAIQVAVLKAAAVAPLHEEPALAGRGDRPKLPRALDPLRIGNTVREPNTSPGHPLAPCFTIAVLSPLPETPPVTTPETVPATDTIALTYAELAQRLGISAASAKRRAVRNRWTKVSGNDGRARVMVPVPVLPPEGTATTRTGSSPGTSPGMTPATDPASLAEALYQQIRQLQADRDRERAEHDRLQAELARERNERAGERERLLEAHRTDLARLLEQHQQERDRLLTVVAELVLRRPWWRRWFQR